MAECVAVVASEAAAEAMAAEGGTDLAAKAEAADAGAVAEGASQASGVEPDVVVRKTVVLRTKIHQIEIPIEVLGADDCEPMFSKPPPLNCRVVGPSLEFPVPPGSGPGQLLDIQVGCEDQQVARIAVPHTAEVGDTILMSRREDGSWRVVRKSTEHSFMLPACNAGDHLRLYVPDGRTMIFPVPEGAEQDMLIRILYTEGSGWSLDCAKEVALPHTSALAKVDWVAGPYTRMLDLLQSGGYLECLAGREEVRVSVPFCGHFHEFAVLGDFLSEHVLSLPGVQRITLCTTEIAWQYVYKWSAAELWFRQNHPAIRMMSKVQDLAEDPLPEADLTIGIHPEATKGGRWFQIIASLLQSCSNGFLAFASFYEVEAQTVRNMVEMCKTPETTVEIVENPHYLGEGTVAHPPIRYLVLVRTAIDSVQE